MQNALILIGSFSFLDCGNQLFSGLILFNAFLGTFIFFEIIVPSFSHVFMQPWLNIFKSSNHYQLSRIKRWERRGWVNNIFWNVYFYVFVFIGHLKALWSALLDCFICLSSWTNLNYVFITNFRANDIDFKDIKRSAGQILVMAYQ